VEVGYGVVCDSGEKMVNDVAPDSIPREEKVCCQNCVSSVSLSNSLCDCRFSRSCRSMEPQDSPVILVGKLIDPLRDLVENHLTRSVMASSRCTSLMRIESGTRRMMA